VVEPDASSLAVTRRMSYTIESTTQVTCNASATCEIAADGKCHVVAFTDSVYVANQLGQFSPRVYALPYLNASKGLRFRNNRLESIQLGNLTTIDTQVYGWE
jgi:hypothetical protein